MKQLLLEQIKNKIAEWDKSGIYAISLFVYNRNDNPCEPVVVLGYNTMEQFQAEIPSADGEEPEESLYEGITEAFIQVLIEVVKELHESNFIKEQFGREISVLIHELEFYEEIAMQNLKANPSEVVEEFVAFCREQ